MGILERIQKKPYKYRIKVTWISLAVSLAILALLWFITSKIKKDASTDTILNTFGTDLKDSREYWQNIMPKKSQNQ